MCQKVRKCSKNDRDMSKGHRSQIEAILIDQIWELQNDSNDGNSGNTLNEIEIHESIFSYLHTWINELKEAKSKILKMIRS